ncbi:MAG: immunoglobulin domain-containing protein [Planctomycetes bacterium]|nr:immunoglobulin domain-containing protein [Planctomycetota bacterium]
MTLAAVLAVAISGSVGAQVVVVDDAGTARNGKVGYWSSLVARNGDVGISYYCEDDHANNPPEMYTLRFAWATGTGWQWTTVDPYYCGSDTSMGRGSDGLYQIVYSGWNGMGWAIGSATNWTVGSVNIPAGLAPSNISMVLDSANRPHVAYMNFANGGDHALRYTYFDGVQWVPGGANGGVVGLDLWTPTIGFSNTYLKLDAAGTPHIAYAQPSDPVNAYGPMQYATLVGGPGGNWQSEPLGVMGEDPSLAIGTDDVPRMAFNSDAGIVYAYKSGGVWQFETVVSASWGSSISMALSDTNNPVLTFAMTANEDMYVARREPGGWVVTRFDGDGTSGPHEILGRYGTSIDVDETGNTHIGYLAIDIYSTTHRCDLRYYGPGGGTSSCVQIVSSPQSASLCGGDSVVFSVNASSPSPMSYQWRLNGIALVDGTTPGGSVVSGATTPDMSIFGVTPSDAGQYTCFVNSDCGNATCAPATLGVQAAAAITGSPASVNGCTGGSASFSVNATGGGLLYDWYHDGALLLDGPTGSGSTVSGSGTAALTITGLSAADAGLYWCTVSNSCGTDTSASASLSVAPCGGGCDGDLNEDGQVDLLDLAILLSHFGDTGGVAPDDGDINLDDQIDLVDLALLLARFGTIC